jgi:hypothetical protein
MFFSWVVWRSMHVSIFADKAVNFLLDLLVSNIGLFGK